MSRATLHELLWVQGLLAQAKRAYRLVDETLDEYVKDRGELMAAGLAFYTLLSIAPLIIIAVALAGAVLGRGAARQEALVLVAPTTGTGAPESVGSWVQQASDSGKIASVVGFALMLYTASRLSGQLRVALNQIWNVDADLADGFKATIRSYVKRRSFAFLLVLASGPLLLVIFASRALLMGLGELLFAGTSHAGVVAQVLQLLFSLVVVTLLAAVVFKFVPDTRVGWRAIWRGAIGTSLLFSAGNWLVGLYLSQASVAQAYGAAGSVVVVLLWIYFSAQMFLLGAEFTQVYARRFGTGLSPHEQQEVSRAREAGERAAGAPRQGQQAR